MKTKRALTTTKQHLGLALLILTPLALWGQAPSSPAAPAALYVEAGSALPGIAGLPADHNLLSLGTDFSAGYDDNIAQTNANREADGGMTISPRLTLNREEGRLGIELDYRPTFRIYRQQSAFNEQDHDLDFAASYRAANRLLFRAQTNVLRRSGLFDSLSSPMPAEPGPVVTLNETVVTPFASQFENDSQASILYAAGPRTTLEMFTTYMLRSFAESRALSVPLFGTEGEGAGLEYSYRATPRATLSLTYLYEAIHTGAGTRLSLDSASAALTFALTSQLEAYVFAGPIYAEDQNVLVLSLGSLGTIGLPAKHSGWQGAAGGRLSWATARQRLLLTGSRQVADGGGLLGAVTSEFIDETFERQLTRKWTLQLATGWERNAELAAAGPPPRLDGVYGRIVVLHPLSESVSAGVGYQYQRQRTAGSLPFGASFDRNYVYFTLQYQIKQIRLGR